MTQRAFRIPPHVKRAYRPNELGKGNPHGTAFIAEATGKTGPGLFPDVVGIKPFLDGIFGNETRRKIAVYLGQRTGARAFSAVNAVKDLKVFDEF